MFCSNPDCTHLVISDWFDLIICVSAFFEETEIILFVFTTWIVFNPTPRNQNEIRIFFFNFNILSAFERTCTQQKRRFCLISKQRISILEKESEWNRIKSETRNNLNLLFNADKVMGFLKYIDKNEPTTWCFSDKTVRFQPILEQSLFNWRIFCFNQQNTIKWNVYCLLYFWLSDQKTLVGQSVLQ